MAEFIKAKYNGYCAAIRCSYSQSDYPMLLAKCYDNPTPYNRAMLSCYGTGYDRGIAILTRTGAWLESSNNKPLG